MPRNNRIDATAPLDAHRILREHADAVRHADEDAERERARAVRFEAEDRHRTRWRRWIKTTAIVTSTLAGLVITAVALIIGLQEFREEREDRKNARISVPLNSRILIVWRSTVLPRRKVHVV